MASSVPGQWLGVGGLEHQFDDALFAGGDIGLAVDDGAVVHERGEGDVLVGGGEDFATGGEDLRRHLHGLGEVAGDVGERGHEQVAEAVTLEIALVEAVLEEPGEQVLVFGERDHAVANVAGGKHFEVFAKAAGGASVVGDGDDGGEVGDGAGGVLAARTGERGRAGRGCDVALEAAQQRREPGASADGDDPQAANGEGTGEFVMGLRGDGGPRLRRWNCLRWGTR
jgi:hypothetical protein